MKTCDAKYIDGSKCTLPEDHEGDKEERNHEQWTTHDTHNPPDEKFLRVKWTTLHPPPIEAFSSNQRRLVVFLLSLDKAKCVEIAKLSTPHVRVMDKPTAVSRILSTLGRNPTKTEKENRLAVWTALRAEGLPFIRPEHLGDDQ